MVMAVIVLIFSSQVALAQAGAKINLWDQKLESGGEPEMVTVINGYEERTITADESGLLFVMNLDVTILADGELYISNGDFIAVDPMGRRVVPVAFKTNIDSNMWTVTRTDIVYFSSRYNKGQEITVSVCFCVPHKFDWERAELRVAVPLDEIVGIEESYVMRNHDRVLDIFNQTPELVRDLTEVRSLDTEDGKYVDEKKMFTTEINVTARADGLLEYSNLDFVLVDENEWRLLASGIRGNFRWSDWLLADEGRTVRIDKEVTIDKKYPVEVCFFIPSDFLWEKAQLRLMVPIRAISTHPLGPNEVTRTIL